MVARKIGWVLTVIGIVAAVGTLLGPKERVLGVDLGATSAAMFWVTVAAGAWLLSKRSDEVFPEHMSITERRAWINTGFLLLILANFVVGMMAIAEHGPPPERLRDLSSRFPMRLMLLVGAWWFCAGALTRDDPFEEDERDKQFQDRADSAANLALNLGIIVAILVLILAPRDALDWWLAPLILAHLLLSLMMAKALVENLVLAISYRRA
jgi:hypothetical protein